MTLKIVLAVDGGRGGGIALFIQNIFEYSEWGVLNLYDTFNFEALFVEVTCIDDNRQIIPVIYLP